MVFYFYNGFEDIFFYLEACLAVLGFQFLFEVLLCLAASRTKIAHQIKLVALLHVVYREFNLALCVENLLSTRNISELFIIGLASVLLILFQFVEELLILLYFGNELQILVQLTGQRGLQLLTEQLFLLLNWNLGQSRIIESLLLLPEVLGRVLALIIKIVNRLLLLLAAPVFVAHRRTGTFGGGAGLLGSLHVQSYRMIINY